MSLVGLLLTDRLEDVSLDRLLEEEALRLRLGPAAALLVLIPFREAFRILTRDERTLQAGGLRFARRDEQHVAVAKQRFGTHGVEDRAAVYLRRHAESDA